MDGKMTVRVRFAPSPTGFLHVGGLRTALYNYLFAQKMGGKCILRIEDTDRTRLVEDAQKNLIESLKWAGVEFDEGPGIGGEVGPYIQSERFDLYKKYSDELIEKGNAYYAFDTAEELDAMRKRLQEKKRDPKYMRDEMRNSLTLPEDEWKALIEGGEKHVVRLKIPYEDIIISDIIRGDVKINGHAIDDQVLLKSDGFPTYHLANVVDDHLMGITHVIRGEEWLPSTPKHALLYDYFGWERPQFAHLPLLLNADKSKLSKRTGSVAVEDFRQEGYLKDALINFVALLGYNPTADRDIYSMQELIDTFNLEKVNKGGAVFDRKKLEWMNQQYMKTMSSETILAEFKPILEKKEIQGFDDVYLMEIVELFKERIAFVKDLPEMASYFFAEPTEFDEKYLKKHWKEETLAAIEPLVEILRNDEEFTKDTTHDLTMKYCEDNEIKLKVVIHPLRLMTTGKSSGAGMFETLAVIGKEKCQARIDKFIRDKIYETV
jgi:glutamyl-tRNA synthetase